MMIFYHLLKLFLSSCLPPLSINNILYEKHEYKLTAYHFYNLTLKWYAVSDYKSCKSALGISLSRLSLAKSLSI